MSVVARFSAVAGSAILMLSAGEASAQRNVRIGEVVNDQLATGDTQRGGGAFVDCYLVSAPEGTGVRVQMQSGAFDSYLEVGTGSCENPTVLIYNDDSGFLSLNSRIDFISGGGAYLIRATTWGGSGSYSLSIQPHSGAARVLAAAGAAGAWLEPGWAPVSSSTQPDPLGDGAGLTPGTVFKDCEDVCPELVVVPAGSFMMGSDVTEAGRITDEGPRHPVSILYPFAVGRYEVTFAEYDACFAERACPASTGDQGWGRGRRPVVGVSWTSALSYTAWLSEKTGRRYSLLSEAEWEYVARAGTTTPWHTGSAILSDDANILNLFQKTVPVGSYAPNAFGLNDVHGNVAEWTLDCSDTGYIGVPDDGSPARSGNCAAKTVIRGGGYQHEPSRVRSAMRFADPPSSLSSGLGFRVARAL